MKYSVIIPVYNRPDEVDELLASLCTQTVGDFEVLVVEDGSSVPCRTVVERYADRLAVRYFDKPNSGPGQSRNYGVERAAGEYVIVLDSDAVLPEGYLAAVDAELRREPCDAFGGPDRAHASFTPMQKAINYAMTSFLTTGGIRGGKVQMEKFVPRTFNMGFTREVYGKVGGFKEMFSEDIDMSTRIRLAGYAPVLLREAVVYHKRRGNLKKFWRQVHVFGMSRITLQLLYPGSMKLVHWLPAVFTVGALALITGAFWCKWLLIPLAVYILALWIWGIAETKSLKVGSMGVAASMVQLTGYGTGFIRAYVWKILLRHGRDEEQEIRLRKGK